MKSVLSWSVALSSVLLLPGCGDENTTNTSQVSSVFDEAPAARLEATVNCNGVIALDAKGSFDAEGKPLTYKWTLADAPAGSKLGDTLSDVGARQVSVLADKTGDYVFQLTVSDGTKQTTVISQTLAANQPEDAPAAANYKCDNPNVFADTVRKATLSAQPNVALSLDGNVSGGTDLNYQWAVVRSPDGSHPVLGNSASAVASFTPEQVGDYSLSLTAQTKSGQAAAAAVVNVRVSTLQSMTLNYNVSKSALIAGTYKLASFADNVFRVHDLNSGAVQTLKLPSTIQSFALSPDGVRALLIEKNTLTTINLADLGIVKSVPLTSGNLVREAVLVSATKAYILQNQSFSSYLQLYPLDVETGVIGKVVDSSYYEYTGFKSVFANTFFLNTGTGNLKKVYLNTDGTIAGTRELSSGSCYNYSGDYTWTVLSDTLATRCNYVYQFKDVATEPAFLGFIDNLGGNYLTGMVMPPDGKAVYGVVRNYNFFYPQSTFGVAELAKFGASTWAKESDIYLPLVLSEDALRVPTIQQLLVGPGNKLMVVAAVSLPQNKYAYYVLK